MIVNDLTAKKFGRLTAVKKAGTSKNGHAIWTCVCDCGNTVNVFATNLRRNHTESCGCLNTEAITKHGKRNCAEYQSWKAMIQRCTNPNANRYDLYGGRGITVHPDWLSSFEKFYADMGPRPAPKKLYSLDRINVNEGYCKENCRWATQGQQNCNKRKKD